MSLGFLILLSIGQLSWCRCARRLFIPAVAFIWWQRLHRIFNAIVKTGHWSGQRDTENWRRYSYASRGYAGRFAALHWNLHTPIGSCVTARFRYRRWHGATTVCSSTDSLAGTPRRFNNAALLWNIQFEGRKLVIITPCLLVWRRMVLDGLVAFVGSLQTRNSLCAFFQIAPIRVTIVLRKLLAGIAPPSCSTKGSNERCLKSIYESEHRIVHFELREMFFFTRIWKQRIWQIFLNFIYCCADNSE